MTQTADTPAGRADQLLAMTARLCDLVAEEIQALKERRLDKGTAGWEDKERLVHAWRLEVSRIKAEPALIAGLDPDRRKALTDAAMRLETVLEGHAHALAAMREVTEGLVRSIAAEISAARAAPPGYGRSGAASGGSAESSGLAVNARV